MIKIIYIRHPEIPKDLVQILQYPQKISRRYLWITSATAEVQGNVVGSEHF